MRLVMLGVQASGKGTQADRISDDLSIPHISTGDILRKNIREMTDLGKLAQTYTSRGELVPDDVIIRVVAARLNERDCELGFILDGFPRTAEQAEALDKITQLDYAIEIDVKDKEAIKRMSGRRTCEKCGAIFSIYQAKEEDLSGACNKCGGKLVIRDDDKEDSIKKRLATYHEETEPLIKHYNDKGILLKINGQRPIEPITEEILKKIKS